MGDYTNKNAQAILEQVQAHIQELEEKNLTGGYTVGADWARYSHKGYDYHKGWTFKMDSVYEALSIFDWWNETLSLSQLKQMEKFLKKAIQFGFTGYVCFKVGAKHCSHGMWAHKQESINGYSPEGDCLFHSFRAGDNYWDAELNGEWLHETYATDDNSCPNFTEQQIRFALGMVK